MTLTAPTGAGTYTSSTTPTFSGAAGMAATDSTTVTVRVYSGAALVQTRTAIAAAGAWSVGASPALAQGTYTVQAAQADAAGNVGTSTTNTLTIDTTAPIAANVTTANVAGGRVGMLDAGDSISFVYSEAMAPASIVAGWTGAGPQSVTLNWTYASGADWFSITNAASTVHLSARLREDGGRDRVAGEVLGGGVGRPGDVRPRGRAGRLLAGAPPGGPSAAVLELTVLDVTPGRPPAVVYFGKLDELRDAGLGRFEPGDAHRYRFRVTFPSSAADDDFQGARATVRFVWTASAPDPGADSPPAPGGAIIEDHVQPSTRPAGLRLRVHARRTQAAHRQRVYVDVYCSRKCTLTATGVASLPSRHKQWRLQALKGSVRAGGTARLRMPLPKQALKPLNTAVAHRKHASVQLRITAATGTQKLRRTRTIHLAR